MTIAGFEITFPVMTLGLLTGMAYGILAVGLILVYRSNRIINFAHGEIGAFGAAILVLAVTSWGLPYWIAFALALAVAAGIGGASETLVIRRLRHAPPLMSVVATLGLAQFLMLFSLVISQQTSAGSLFPRPTWLPEFDVGALRVHSAYSAMLLFTPVLVLALFLFLRTSTVGLAIRASAANREAASMAGVSPGAMSRISWMIAGAVAAFTAVLVLPTRAYTAAEFLGPALLLRALAPSVIARMTSLPIAFAGGICVGILEALLLWNNPQGGVVEAALFVTILAVLLFQRRQGGREEVKGAWTAVQPWQRLPESLLQVRTIRNLGLITAGAAAVVALVLPLFVSNVATASLTTIAAFSVVGLSVGIITGLGGQLSLGQFAIAGVGGVVAIAVSDATGSFLVAFVAGGLAAAGVSLVIGLPALRIHGLMLVVTTLGFALAAQTWLFNQPWAFGDGVSPVRPRLGGIVFDSAKSYYLLSLAVLAVCLWLASNVWRGGIGRRLRATRDNEDAARAFTVPVTAVKLQGFLIAGFLAGIGGAVYGHALSRVTATAYPVEASIWVAAMAVLGGIGVLAGPLVGALYIIGVPRFLPLDNAGLAGLAIGWLVLILYFPGGVAQLIAPIRQWLVGMLARQAGVEVTEAPASEPVTAGGRLGLEPRPVAGETTSSDPVLRVEGLTRRYGGIVAVDGVTFDVRAGETLGLIGPNGAGKTTLFELIGGFTRQDEGSVTFRGTDVSRMRPQQRGHLGLIRSFQDAGLFPTLTVTECIQVALERTEPTSTLAELVGMAAADRRKEVRARELAGMMGLHAYRDRQVSELSTGTRRITELACLVALEPTLLLLDEPSSGIAQRETEALGDVLLRLKEHVTGLTLIVVEHDMPLIMRLSDRLVAMESGRVIAVGDPVEVRSHAQVVESYLGGDLTAIMRSGTRSASPASAAGDERCTGTTRAGERCSRRAVADGLCRQHQSQLAARR